MTTTTTPNGSKMYADVIDAMRSIITETDQWHLAEELVKLIPSGTKGFDQILDQANKAGVTGKVKSVHSLRQYRDTAKRWPANTRVPNVSFTAHREAMAVADSAEMLKDLSKNLGPSGVTAAEVRRQVRIKQGKKPAAKKGSTGMRGDAVRDLVDGGPKLRAAITAAMDLDQLDKVHTGLNKVLEHVDRLRAKKARNAKASAAKKATPTKATATKKVATPKQTRGDLRGL